jgi:transposase
MLSPPPSLGIYLCTEPVDMRKSFDGLSALVLDVLERDPISGELFAFSNRTGDKLKILYYDGQGLCLWYKRLERGRFRILESPTEAQALTAKELSLLVDGLDIGLAARSPRRKIRVVA